MCCIIINITKDMQFDLPFTQPSHYWLSKTYSLALLLELRALCNINKMITM